MSSSLESKLGPCHVPSTPCDCVHAPAAKSWPHRVPHRSPPPTGILYALSAVGSLLFNSLETCNAKPRCLVLVALTCGRHDAASGHGQPPSCNLPVLLRSAGRLLLRPDPRCTSSTPGCRGRRATTNVAAALCSWTWTKPGAQGGGSWREPRRAFIIRRRRHALGGWRLIKHFCACA